MASIQIYIRDDNYFELTDETFLLVINDLLLPKHITYGNIEKATVTIVSNESKYVVMLLYIHTRSVETLWLLLPWYINIVIIYHLPPAFVFNMVETSNNDGLLYFMHCKDCITATATS